MIRFLHSSDLHLGKPFGRFPEDVRARLRQARADVLPKLGALAMQQGASHILLAGDIFDQTTPAPAVIRQAMNAMGGFAGVTWVMMPGNHDHANATELWRQVLRDAPDNVAVLLKPAPFALTDSVVLLPAPPTERHPGRDLTDWFDSAATGEAIRIGLAHGSVTDFNSSEEGGSSVISITRARSAGLAYLGLGDWHGQLQVGPQTWYSGAPEADGFKHAARASALLVEVAGQAGGQAAAKVTSLPTGSLHWQRQSLDLTDLPEVLAAHDAALPPLAQRSNTLFDLRLTGRVHGLAQVRLEQATRDAAPDFLWHQADFAELAVLHDSGDLDAIDQQGALRAAAEVLAAEAEDAGLSPEDRALASAALSLLFSYALEAE